MAVDLKKLKEIKQEHHERMVKYVGKFHRAAYLLSENGRIKVSLLFSALEGLVYDGIPIYRFETGRTTIGNAMFPYLSDGFMDDLRYVEKTLGTIIVENDSEPEIVLHETALMIADMFPLDIEIENKLLEMKSNIKKVMSLQSRK